MGDCPILLLFMFFESYSYSTLILKFSTKFSNSLAIALTSSAEATKLLTVAACSSMALDTLSVLTAAISDVVPMESISFTICSEVATSSLVISRISCRSFYEKGSLSYCKAVKKLKTQHVSGLLETCCVLFSVLHAHEGSIRVGLLPTRTR